MCLPAFIVLLSLQVRDFGEEGIKALKQERYEEAARAFEKPSSGIQAT